MLRRFLLSATAIFLTTTAIDILPARASTDFQTCANDRVKTAVLPQSALIEAEAACSRVLASNVGGAEQQKAAFFRGLVRFLRLVQGSVEQVTKPDGSVSYAAPELSQLGPALADIETAIGLDGPLKAEALALRVTINQTLGRHAEAQADIDRAMQVSPKDATPFVQRALEHERAGNVTAALADLDKALEIESAAGTALSARGELLRRLGFLLRARTDFAAAAKLGPPFRRLALIHKSKVELRAGDLKAAYEDLLAAAEQDGDLPTPDVTAARAQILIDAGHLANDKLKNPDIAEKHFQEASRLAPTNWNGALGLARLEEQRGNRDKAAAIYRRILTATETTPKLFERMLASFRLKQLMNPPLRRARAPFRDAFDVGVLTGVGSPDGLKRAAFVIGQGNYAKLASLPNPPRDAAVMANALAEMGFDSVKIAEDLDASDLRSIPAAIAEEAAKVDVVVVFYAGHGVELSGSNYLVPVDAAPASDRDIRNGALTLTDLSAAAAKARRGSLVIVDACRDDPFVEARAAAQSRASNVEQRLKVPERLHSGLAPAKPAAPNHVVFHSTQPGQVALDGDGLDSPFVRALLETLATPGQPFPAVLRDTTTRVAEMTERQQVPSAYGTPPDIALLPPPGAR